MSWGTTGPVPSWRDDFTGRQLPDVTAVDDLSRFVMDRIVHAESEPQHEVPQSYNQPAGPMAHRYAGHVRRDMVAFRKIVAQYVVVHSDYEAETDPNRRYMLAGCALVAAGAMSALAERWADHPDFRDSWSIAVTP